MKEYLWSDLHVGLAHQFEARVTPEMMRTFAELCGDHNPLHLDRSFAIHAGFADVVVYGLLTSAFYSRLVGVYLPGKHALLHGMDVDFVAPVYCGDLLQVLGEVTYLNEHYRRIEIQARTEKKGGGLVSKATLRVGLHGS